MPQHRSASTLHTGCILCVALLAGRACVEGLALGTPLSRQGNSPADGDDVGSHPPGPGDRLLLATLPSAGRDAAGLSLLLGVGGRNATAGGPALVKNFHGQFDKQGGVRFLVESILEGLDGATLNALRNCSLGIRGQTNAVAADDGVRVWIVVNAEEQSGEYAWGLVRGWVNPQDRVLILGTRWNDTRRGDIVREGRATGMYVPFASLNFAERRRHTPMDLYERSSINFGGERPGDLAYQQRNCRPGQYREAAFTTLDSGLRLAGRGPASALSRCHGENPPGGYTNAEGVHCDEKCTNYDRSVGRYEDFRFILTMEHGTQVLHDGYITEKMVDAFLAGAVPISDSSAERAEIFNNESYVAVDPGTREGRRAGVKAMFDLLNDPQEWDRRRRLPSVTAESLRKYFSWHPAVWKSHGDFLRRQIVREVQLLCS